MKSTEIGNYAVSCVGKHRNQVGCAGEHDWCANWVSNVLNACGIKITNFFVGPLRDDLLKSGLFYEPEDYPKFGDIMEIDFDHKVEERPLDHIVIVKKYDESTNKVTYISGNGNSSTRVTEETITLDDKYMFWQRYKEDTASSETKPQPQEQPSVTVEDKTFTRTLRVLKNGCCGADVKTLQQLLFAKGYACGADDGEFGPKTEKSVKDFQKGCGIASDGIVGNDTFKRLWGY